MAKIVCSQVTSAGKDKALKTNNGNLEKKAQQKKTSSKNSFFFTKTATTFVSGKDALLARARAEKKARQQQRRLLQSLASPTCQLLLAQLTEALLQRGILSDLDETRQSAYARFSNPFEFEIRSKMLVF